MNNIVIREENEHKPTIVDFSNKESYFHDAYQQAEKMIIELVGANDDQKCERIRSRHKNGNNIIMFCGKRGQGKTSAMLSLACYLKNENGQDKKLEGKKFYLLEAIDPSYLNGDESIVRVMLSRLYNKFSEMVKNKCNDREKKKDSFLFEKSEVIRLFEKCFQSIDYSTQKSINDIGMDNLELLAQLGNSSKLRENLGKLIDAFFKFKDMYVEDDDGCKKHDSEGYKKYTSDCYKKCNYGAEYLVIQIDDADLALNGVFKMCEDIGNYFSLPNVIVLMAADIDQLNLAIEQEYVKKHNELIRNSDELRKDYFLECKKMASRYMEKMFPVGHRIDLPLIDEKVKWNGNDVKVKYMHKDCVKNEDINEKNGNKKEDEIDMFAGYSGICHDYQEQLFRALYEKTGMIFDKSDENVHLLLPSTMRELTQFLKLLRSMEMIDLYKAFKSDGEDNQKLLCNLELFEHYFFDFWCCNNLSGEERIHIKKSYEEIIRERDEVSFMASRFKSENDTEKEGEKQSENLKKAYAIIYTIIMNKQFARVAGKHIEYNKLMEGMGKALILPWNNYKLEDNTHLNWAHFRVPKNFIKNDDVIDVMNEVTFRATFTNCEKNEWEFDLGTYIFVPQRKEEESESIKNNTNDSSIANNAKLYTETNQQIIPDVNYLLGIKNLFANYEIYEQISKKIKEIIVRIDKNEYSNIEGLYKSIFAEFNLENYRIGYLEIPQIIQEIVSKKCNNLFWKTMFAKMFWKDEENSTELQKTKSKRLGNYVSIIMDAYNNVIGKLDTNDLTVPLNVSEWNEKLIRINIKESNEMLDSADKRKLLNDFRFLTKRVEEYNTIAGLFMKHNNLSEEHKKQLKDIRQKLLRKKRDITTHYLNKGIE